MPRNFLAGLTEAEDTKPEGTIHFLPNSIARAVFNDLTNECGLDHAQIFLVADALLTLVAVTLQKQREEALAEARAQAEHYYAPTKRPAAFSTNRRKWSQADKRKYPKDNK
jgi:hypothetical protein